MFRLPLALFDAANLVFETEEQTDPDIPFTAGDAREDEGSLVGVFDLIWQQIVEAQEAALRTGAALPGSQDDTAEAEADVDTGIVGEGVAVDASLLF